MIVPILLLASALATTSTMQEPTAIPEEPSPAAPAGPIIQFNGAYPFDTQSVLEVTADNSRAFVAEGASIAILNLNSISGSPPAPDVIERVALENAAPLALRHYKHPVSGEDYLFVAGGTMGL